MSLLLSKYVKDWQRAWVLKFRGSRHSLPLFSGFSGRSGSATGTIDNMGGGAVVVGALHCLAPGKVPHLLAKTRRLWAYRAYRSVLPMSKRKKESNIPDSRGEVGRSKHHQLLPLCLASIYQATDSPSFSSFLFHLHLHHSSCPCWQHRSAVRSSTHGFIARTAT